MHLKTNKKSTTIIMANYFNTLSLSQKLDQLSKCRFMESSEFEDGVAALIGKTVVIVGCGAQGLNQGLNMRDSGLNISYALREKAIKDERQSFKNASSNGFTVGTYEQLIPTADLVLNLTPDKQHSNVVDSVMPLMKQGATLAYSHGFNIVEEGKQIREDLTVIMVAPKCPGIFKRIWRANTNCCSPGKRPGRQGLVTSKSICCGDRGSQSRSFRVLFCS
jgi:ketol-acid reductoisomerase